MLDEDRKTEYKKYIEALWKLYDKAVESGDNSMVLQVLAQIRLEVV